MAARWAPPMQLSPATSDPDEARQWFDDFRTAGVEGLVVKGAGTRYAPGRREWLKVKSWESTEVVAGGVIGPIGRPSQLVAGRYRDGELVVVGRTSPLNAQQAAELAAVLTPAGREPPVARADRHRPVRRREAVGGAHAGRTDRRRRGERRRGPAGRRLPAPAALRADPPRSAPGGRRPAALSGRRARRPGQRIVRPRRLSTRRSSGANRSSSIATPTTRISVIEVITSDIWDSSRPRLSS